MCLCLCLCPMPCAGRIWVPGAFFSEQNDSIIWLPGSECFHRDGGRCRGRQHSPEPALYSPASSTEMLQPGSWLSRLCNLQVCPGQQSSTQEDVGNPREKTQDCEEEDLSQGYTNLQSRQVKLISIKLKINFSSELFLGPWQRTGLQHFQGAHFARYFILSN